MITLGGEPCLDPRTLRGECLRLRLPVETWWGKPNSYACPVGREPASGRVLLSRASLDALGLSAGHELVFDDGENPAVKLSGVSVVRATCLTPQDSAGRPDAAYLVELTDLRGLARLAVIDKAYNLREDASGYLGATEDGGSPWTWAGMCEDLWDACGNLGAFPGLPYEPDGEPEGWRFYAASAWDALSDVLDRLDCAFRVEPVSGVTDIVRLGATDEIAAAAVETQTDRGRLVWNDWPADPARHRVPETARVAFRRFPAPATGASEYYVLGRTDADADPGTVAGTEEVLFDDLAALGASGTPSNDSDLSGRADERAANFFGRRRFFEARASLVFSGSLKTLTAAAGSNYGAAAWEDRGAGFKTSVRAGRRDYGDPVKRQLDARGVGGGGLLMGKLDGALAYQGSATMSVWAWDGSADADTGENVTVYDWLLSSGQSVASGKQVVAAYVGGRWRVIGSQCS